MLRSLTHTQRLLSGRLAKKARQPLLESLERRLALSVTFNEFPMPATDSANLPAGSVYETAGGITVGPDGNYWFAEPAAVKGEIVTGPDGQPKLVAAGDPKIAVVDATTHAISEFPLAAGMTAAAITTGPDGNLWFTDIGGGTKGGIGDINPTTHAISEFPIQRVFGTPFSITTGSDGNLWFTETMASRIGEIDPTTHVINDFPVLTPPAQPNQEAGGTQPTQITSGPGGKLWFTQLGYTKASPSDPHAESPGQIGELDPTTHAITEFALPSGYSQPTSITQGPDGDIWFADTTTDGLTAEIGRLDPATGKITEFALGAEQHVPWFGGSFFFPPVESGADGNVWFSWPLASGDVIGDINPTTGTVSTSPTSSGHSIAQMARGSDGNFWYTENTADIGEAVVSSSGSSSHNQAYITAVYNDVLGRAPDADGLTYWMQKLDSGEPRSSVANAIGKSDEYYQNFVIKPDYLKILGRAADDNGLAHWTAQMDAGTTDQQLEADLAASDEVYANAGGTNLAWVDSLYKLLLNRTADADGEKYWTGKLTAGASRIDVAQGIAASKENNTQLINDDYFHYLGRAADPDGLAFWLGKFADGETNEDVIAGFTGADEYYNKHTS